MRVPPRGKGHAKLVAAPEAPVLKRSLLPVSSTVAVKLQAFVRRSCSGFAMIFVFCLLLYLGHVYCCLLVFGLQCVFFSEMIAVPKVEAIEKSIPALLRIQWAFFLVACLASWSSGARHFYSHTLRNSVPSPPGYQNSVFKAFLDYCLVISTALFAVLNVMCVRTFREEIGEYQITQYSWMVFTICVVVLQAGFAFYSVYIGLAWFVLAASAVCFNDIMAYCLGQVVGKKFVNAPLAAVSPNKSWEGFSGSAVCTICFSGWIAGKLSLMQWMTCPPEEITFALTPLTCTPSRMFRPQPLGVIVGNLIGTQHLWLVPTLFGSLLDVEISVFELHALCLGFLASFVAPFGGLMQSAIKRAYGLKDYGNVIPGHGGVLDRFDCMPLMFLCTYVYCKTFVDEMAYAHVA